MLASFIPAYLEAKESAWAYSTWKSEKSRLNAVSARLALSPRDLHEALKMEGYGPYSIKTLFIRLVDLEKWAKLPPKFQDYLDTHKNRFKHAYEKEEIELTYDEARERIKLLSEPARSMADSLLSTGLRISEAYNVKDGKVAGKGGKVRKIFGTIEVTASKSTFARKLKAVGLKPHTLRKLCATRLAELGASPADLCKVMGWSDIKTAYQYLQAKENEKLEALMDACKARP